MIETDTSDSIFDDIANDIALEEAVVVEKPSELIWPHYLSIDLTLNRTPLKREQISKFILRILDLAKIRHCSYKDVGNGLVELEETNNYQLTYDDTREDNIYIGFDFTNIISFSSLYKLLVVLKRYSDNFGAYLTKSMVIDSIEPDDRFFFRKLLTHFLNINNESYERLYKKMIEREFKHLHYSYRIIKKLLNLKTCNNVNTPLNCFDIFEGLKVDKFPENEEEHLTTLFYSASLDDLRKMYDEHSDPFVGQMSVPSGFELNMNIVSSDIYLLGSKLLIFLEMEHIYVKEEEPQFIWVTIEVTGKEELMNYMEQLLPKEGQEIARLISAEAYQIKRNKIYQ